MLRDATAFLLDVLKPNLPKHGVLQTKALEINLVTSSNMADAILANGIFQHYDHLQIVQLFEKAGVYMRTLQFECTRLCIPSLDNSVSLCVKHVLTMTHVPCLIVCICHSKYGFHDIVGTGI